MPVTPKTKLLQVRIEQDLFDRFAAACDDLDQTVSSAVRFFIRDKLAGYEKRAEAARSRQEAVSSAIATEVPSSVKKSPVGLVCKPQTASQMNAARKEAKKALKAKRADKF